jgi:hypothetical protein
MSLHSRNIDTADFCQKRAINYLTKNRRGFQWKERGHWKDGNIHFIRFEVYEGWGQLITCEYLLFQVDSKGDGMRIYHQKEHLL